MWEDGLAIGGTSLFIKNEEVELSKFPQKGEGLEFSHNREGLLEQKVVLKKEVSLTNTN